MRRKTKTCFKCGERKPLPAFYAHPRMADGHLNKCKECTKKDVTEHRAANLDRVQAYDRRRGRTPERKAAVAARAATPAGRRAHREACREHRLKYPERTRARSAVHNAIRDGRLTRGPCGKCGTTVRVHAHHEDYAKPLDVEWLCSACHGQAHRKYED